MKNQTKTSTLRFATLTMLMALILSSAAWADIAIEGEVDRMVRITNLDDFPEYEFYIEYQGYHYDRGYQPDELMERSIYNDSLFYSGERGSRSAIYARHIESGEVFVSEDKVGGNKIVSERRAQKIEDVYEIVKIADGKVKIKMTDSQLHLPGGKTKQLHKMGITGINLFGVDMAYFVFPLLCLAALVFFFMRRRKATA